ncbi:hypothetical protein [Agrobacterium tumefaciens]|uniref:hypothetical protein n=1 Tax=Agrobacterium tumefaciens TaxID=358 RepID=UPI0015746636|nr:hypothetical protein [Agrobacterium tumefaciens]NSX92643.1 hypothetical protein [Agrobacterium tumefaciens]NSX92704.1 hypothetical protein [Agrobacterium tumefaciens]
MMKKVFRDAGGALINIGEWDYQFHDVHSGDFDDGGEPLIISVAGNPLPAGAYEDQADIVVGWDGGLYEAGDVRAQV